DEAVQEVHSHVAELLVGYVEVAVEHLVPQNPDVVEQFHFALGQVGAVLVDDRALHVAEFLCTRHRPERRAHVREEPVLQLQDASSGGRARERSDELVGWLGGPCRIAGGIDHRSTLLPVVPIVNRRQSTGWPRLTARVTDGKERWGRRSRWPMPRARLTASKSIGCITAIVPRVDHLRPRRRHPPDKAARSAFRRERELQGAPWLFEN